MKSPDLFKKGTVLLYVTKDPNERNSLTELLSDRYSFIYAQSADGGMEVLDEFGGKLAAALISEECAMENDCAFLKEIAGRAGLANLAIIIICSKDPAEGGVPCIDNGAQDFIRPPFHPMIIVNRIENAIRAKNAMSIYELERMLKELPSNIFLKDTEARYVFATQYWHHLDQGDDPNWTIRGKTDLDIRKDKENAMEALKADMELLRTGKGTEYTIEINTDGVQEFMEIIKRPVRDNKGRITGIVGLINDVTQKELLKLRLQQASTTDGLTGVYNRGTTHGYIVEALEEYRRSGTPACLLMFDLDDFKKVNDTYGHQSGDAVLIAFAGILRNTHSGRSKAGRWGGEEFMLLLCDTELPAAISIGEKIREAFAATDFPGMQRQTVSIGATQAKDEDTADTLCSRVDAALYRAKASGKNRVVPL